MYSIRKSQPVADMTDEELKQVAMDLFNNKIFTNFHINPNSSKLQMHFYPLLFGGPKPPCQNANLTLAEKRTNTLWEILYKDEESFSYEKDFLASIGMVYGFWGNELPRYLNGMPIFMSAKYLNRSDTTKMFEYYDKYKKLREEVDNF